MLHLQYITTSAHPCPYQLVFLCETYTNDFINLPLTGLYSEAERLLGEAIEQMPENHQFYYSLGVLMGKLHRLEVNEIIGCAYFLVVYIACTLQEGKELLNKAISMNPTAANYHANLGK